MHLYVRNPEHAYIDENLWIPKSQINTQNIQGALTFNTTVTRGSSSTIRLFRETPTHIVVPRLFLPLSELTCPVVDLRPDTYEAIPYKSTIQLDIIEPHETKQQDAFNAIQESTGGTIQLACGKGKTVIALETIAAMGVPALVIVNTKQLIQQWMEEASKLLPGVFLGLLGKVSKRKGRAHITFTTYQKLAMAGCDEEDRRRFGVIVFDEEHHVGAETFSYAANLFPGKRVGLSATPDRADGMQVIHQLHIGPVLYKNLTQPLQPEIFFLQTNFSINEADPDILRAIMDSMGEIHLGKLAGFLGRQAYRLKFIRHLCKKLLQENRKILVISQSLDNLLNLYCLWNDIRPLYTDAVPRFELTDKELSPKEIRKLEKRLVLLKEILETSPEDIKKENYEKEVGQIVEVLGFQGYLKTQRKEWSKKQKAFVKECLTKPSTAGLMTGQVPKRRLQAMLKEHQLVFAIDSYGIEGMDEQTLDTVILCEPMPRKENIQQLMGRMLRPRRSKQPKFPELYVLEDEIQIHIALCRKMQTQFNNWPTDEGGPFPWKTVHPQNLRP